MPLMELKGQKYDVERSTRPDKKLMVKCPQTGKIIHFGQRGARSWYKAPFSSLLPKDELHDNEEKRKQYLARATKIKKKDGTLAVNDPCSPNWWSVNGLW